MNACPLSARFTVCATASALVLGFAVSGFADATLWTFSNSANRFSPASGAATLGYWDPDTTGWGPQQTSFGAASSFGLPAMAVGGDPDVMKFPTCTTRQGYQVQHSSAPNGSYGRLGKVSNYTLILDILYAAESEGSWRALYQADPSNADDGEAYVRNTVPAGVGILGQYHGDVKTNTWHRLAFVVRAAPGEGQMLKFIDGTFVAAQGTTGSGLEERFALDPTAFLLFTDDDAETFGGYVASIYFVDRQMTMDEIKALGGPNAAGANVPGQPAAPIPQQLDRLVGAIGHRGNSCCAPENTLASISQALSNQAHILELDTRMTGDGVGVLMHDATVDRTTDGTGLVSAMTLDQIKTLDAGAWFDPRYAGERVPTLSEVMLAVKDKGICYLDLKETGIGPAILNAIFDTEFPITNLWLWVYDNEAEALNLRSLIADAQIVWGDPPPDWSSDPNFFQHKRDIGVVMFDLGSGGGNVDPVFVATAKREGFRVAVYTILTPDSMVRASANGVDYLETDVPAILHEITPVPLEAASRPNPPDRATNQPTRLVLSWLVGSESVTHRLYFGTNNPPPLVGEQTSDLFLTGQLSLGTRHFWRVDEIKPTGVVTGAVWSFTTLGSGGQFGPVYEWTFDTADLAPALGNGVMTYADGAVTEGLTQFGLTDGTILPHIGGEPSSYVHVPAFSDPANGYLVEFNNSLPNGGGAYINQYTVLFDLLIPGSLNWTALFNTNPENGNDADWYVAADGSLGIGELGYSGANVILPDTWHRVAFAADLGAGAVKFYVDGNLVRERTGGSLLDGRFSLYSPIDQLPSLLLFNEGDGAGVYTHELYVSSFAFTDRTMGSDEIAVLGGPKALGIFVTSLPPISVSNESGSITLHWTGSPNVRLQKTASLNPPDWQDVPNTVGTDAYSEPATGDSAFFRLIR